MLLAIYATATSTSSTSTATTTSNSAATGAPSIRGTPAEVGKRLDVSGDHLLCEISDDDGLSNLKDGTYQWLDDDTEITGATSTWYTVQPDDAAKTIKVRVSFTDDFGNAESLTSEATDPVPTLYLSGITRVRYAENGTSTVATYEVIGAATGTTITWSLTGPDSDDFSINSTVELQFSSGVRVAHRLRHGQHVPRDRERRRR